MLIWHHVMFEIIFVIDCFEITNLGSLQINII